MKLKLFGIAILLSGIFSLPPVLALITGNFEIPSEDGAGGGGWGPPRLIPTPTPPPVFGANVYDLGPSFLIDVLKSRGLNTKTFFNFPLFLAPSLITAGIYPSPTSPLVQGVIETPIQSIDAGVSVKAVKGVEVLSKESIDKFYNFSAEKVLEKYPSTDVVIIGTREPPVDSMAAVAYAKSLDAPILLTESDDAPEDTINAVKKLNPKKIVIVGGPVAVSNDVESEFKKIAPTERIWGETRYETAVEIAKRLDPNMIVITDGEAPSSDAVILASEYKAPILYVRGKELPTPTRDFLVKHTKTEDGSPMSWVTVGVDKDIHTEIVGLYVLPEFLTRNRFVLKLYQFGTRFLT